MLAASAAWSVIALLLVGGFVLLAKGADWLVGGGAEIARRLGVRPLVIGLTVVAWGTSAPEVVVSAVSAGEGHTAIALGNVMGSNAANVGLVLGLCGLVLPRLLATRLGLRDTLWALVSLGVVWILLADGALSRADAGLLLTVFAVHTLMIWVTARRLRAEPSLPRPGRLPPWLLVLLGGAGTVVGAQLVVVGAERGALALGVDQRVVGLTLVALGTSLPELAAGLAAALRGDAEISLGNVVGSNVFNLLAVLGVAGLVRPLEERAMPGPDEAAELAAAVDGALHLDLWVVGGFTLALVLVGRFGRAEPERTRLGRAKAGLLLAAYGLYAATLY